MFVYFIYVKPMNRMVLGNKQYNTIPTAHPIPFSVQTQFAHCKF